MMGIPKTIATLSDLQHLVAMHNLTTDEDTKAQLKTALEREIHAIEHRQCIHCPILIRDSALRISEDGTHAAIGYCNEIAVGQILHGDNEVLAVTHAYDDTDAPIETVVQLAKPIPEGETVIHVPKTVDTLEEMGMTQDQFDEIKRSIA